MPTVYRRTPRRLVCWVKPVDGQIRRDSEGPDVRPGLFHVPVAETKGGSCQPT